MVIVKAAIMYQNGEIIEGHNYGEIAALGNRLSFAGEKIHGFLTSTGEFVLPKEAAPIAFEQKQISEQVDSLTPDMLWPYSRDDS